jgi:hypothetical protein
VIQSKLLEARVFSSNLASCRAESKFGLTFYHSRNLCWRFPSEKDFASRIKMTNSKYANHLNLFGLIE